MAASSSTEKGFVVLAALLWSRRDYGGAEVVGRVLGEGLLEVLR